MQLVVEKDVGKLRKGGSKVCSLLRVCSSLMTVFSQTTQHLVLSTRYITIVLTPTV